MRELQGIIFKSGIKNAILRLVLKYLDSANHFKYTIIIAIFLIKELGQDFESKNLYDTFR